MNTITINPYKTKIIIFLAWLVVSIFFAYQYLLRVMPSVIMQDLMQQFALDTKLFGQFSGVYYIGYAAAHLPLGFMLDSYGTKRVMPICILLAVLGTLPIIFSQNCMIALIGRFIVGVGSSGAILSAFKVVYSIFGPEKFTRILSFTITIGLLGAVYGGAPLNYLCSNFDYKYIALILAVIGFILSMVSYIIIPEFSVKRSRSILANIKEVFSNKMILIVCCCAGLMIGPLEGFADLWGKQFLELKYTLDSNVASGLTSTLFLGACFGAPLLSYLATRISNDSVTIFLAGITMSIAFIIILLGLGNIMTLSITLSIIGCCCNYQTYAIFKASTYAGAQAIGVTTAVANMIIMLFGYGFHTTLGVVVDAYGGSNSVVALQYGIAVITIGLILGSICFIIIYLREIKFFKFVHNVKY